MQINLVTNLKKNWNDSKIINIKNGFSSNSLFSLISEIGNFDASNYYLIVFDENELNFDWISEAFTFINNTYSEKKEVYFFKKTSYVSGNLSKDKDFSDSDKNHLPSYIIKGSVLNFLSNYIDFKKFSDVLYQERIICALINKLWTPVKIDSALSYTFTDINGRFNNLTIYNRNRSFIIIRTHILLKELTDNLNIQKSFWFNLISNLSRNRFHLFSPLLFLKLAFFWGYKPTIKFINIKSPILFSADYSKYEDIEIINFEQFKNRRDLIAKKLIKIFNNYSVKGYPAAMSGLGQILLGKPIHYDDDIDITVDYLKYKEHFKNIRKDLLNEGIILQRWNEWNGHNSVICIDKVYDSKIYHVMDKDYNVNAILSPFIDIGKYLNFDPGKFKYYESYYKNLKKLKAFRQNSKNFSKFRSRNLERNSWVMEKSFKILSYLPYRIYQKYLIYKSNLILKLSSSNEFKVGDKIYTLNTSADAPIWGLVSVQNGNNFLGEPMLQYSDIDSLFFKRYGHPPIIFDNSLAVPSHMNYESINFLYNKKHWLNTKLSKKVIKNRS